MCVYRIHERDGCIELTDTGKDHGNVVTNRLIGELLGQGGNDQGFFHVLAMRGLLKVKLTELTDFDSA
jgi:hypothetical protein